MSKFDTHGGYFAPKDYMKVEAGGSHEENPNGGVQIGVDQEGTPNLLEEGEPVYKDYVYSDNIKASERFLKENNIPEKYAGELYSKIADSFFSEAENRPYDPISRNGLEAMLGRLADAQEGQKAYNEQRQLERELKNLSPDELAALEGMLAAGEQQAMEQPVESAEPMMPQQPTEIEQPIMMGCGGKVNKFDGKDKSFIDRGKPFVGWETTHFGKPNPGYSPTNIGYMLYPIIGKGRQPSGAIGTYQTLQGYKWPGQLTVDDAVIPDPEEIILDPVVPPSPSAPVVKKASSVVQTAPATTVVSEPISRAVYARAYGLDPSKLATSPSTIGGLVGERPISSRLVTESVVPDTVEDGAVAGSPYLSTLPRYAGAIGSGLLGLYNAFQRPDEYTATRYKPFTPSGMISFQNQVYNPVDQNMMMNQVLAQGNSAQRALRNSGLGPSTAAAMVAQDNNITGNLGNTFLQTWDANNQRRNQVIAANNQNEAQRAQFDYAIDAARQRALSDAQMRNAYTDLQIQQLNNAAEGEKYAAVSNQISNALQALSGIGQENFAMNQVNSNPANEGYGILGGGIGAYLPYYYRRNYKCGGKKK